LAGEDALIALDDFAKLPARIAQWAAPLYCLQLQVMGIDALLMAAHMDRETNGRNVVGDGGHGRGLMQLDDRTFVSLSNARTPAGDWVLMDPNVNIYLGARHWMGYYKQALKLRSNPMDARSITIARYNSGRAFAAAEPNTLAGQELIRALDLVTTDKDYCSDVLRRYLDFGQLIGGTQNAPSA